MKNTLKASDTAGYPEVTSLDTIKFKQEIKAFIEKCYLDIPFLICKSTIMKFIVLLLIGLFSMTPTLFLAQSETEEEIEFAFIDDVKGKPGDAIFLKEKKYQETYQFQVANEVFETLVDARGDFRMQKPTFKMSKSERKVAVAKPRKREIILEMKAYKICTSFGKDSLNAIAALLSHELIHYYEKHQWSKYFASQNEGTSTGSSLKKLNERLKLETQSDFLGGFLAYSAGYQTLDIMPQFLEKCIKAIDSGTHSEGILHSRNAKNWQLMPLSNYKTFIHVFKTANYLTALKQYEQAKLYFDYILKDYQSREIYNNVGVVAALVGMQYVDGQLLKYGLPLELDAETRLESNFRGSKEKEMAQKILEEAIEYFEKAGSLDKNYPIALLNIACTHFLLNNFDDAEYFARKALKLCNSPKWEKTKSDIYTLQGILAAYQDDPAEAENLFLKAKQSGNSLANTNLNILKGITQGGVSVSTVDNSKKDQIDGFSIDKAIVQLLRGELNVDKLVEVNKSTMCGI